ncbi:Microspherule protein 1 [Morus notabilis]|uniref:Microspherule protein 1 n=2 Tax=Morus notabilis TaxID=981085 RepID=W9SKV3_9ROSA|nr:Microspherule protein 1 [Morus notabilis]
MDLSPDYEDSYLSKKASQYWHEDAKRNIVRLEQCARSSMQRAIASQGAFAILYGRNVKQYIKETEVILGRATEDNEVDIDLRKEGRANKISRRQALIKMEEDGSFFLKNIGKSSIFLNGKEVAAGHRLCLSSSTLIEISGMSFVFEMNHKSVRRYLVNVGKNSKEKYAKFECSPAGNQ